MEVKVIGQMDNTIDHTFESANRVYDAAGVSPTINTCGGGGLQPKILEDAQAIRMVRTEEGKALRKEYESGAIHHGFNEHREMELRTDGVSNTLTSVQKDNLVMEVKQLGFMDNGTGKHQSNTVYDEKGVCPNITTIEGGGTQQIKVMTENVYDFYNNNLKLDGVCGTLTSSCSHNGSGTFGVIEPQYRIRKLTPRECWRLMDFTDEDFEKAAQVNSNTQLYKQAGNSIIRNVLVAILGQLIEGKEDAYRKV